jgi:hypothetical protein
VTSSSISEDSENEFIRQLMKQFGNSFTGHIERMFQDFADSKIKQEGGLFIYFFFLDSFFVIFKNSF